MARAAPLRGAPATRARAVLHHEGRWWRIQDLRLSAGLAVLRVVGVGEAHLLARCTAERRRDGGLPRCLRSSPCYPDVLLPFGVVCRHLAGLRVHPGLSRSAEPARRRWPDAVVVTLLTAPARALSPCGRFRASPPVVEAICVADPLAPRHAVAFLSEESAARWPAACAPRLRARDDGPPPPPIADPPRWRAGALARGVGRPRPVAFS